MRKPYSVLYEDLSPELRRAHSRVVEVSDDVEVRKLLPKVQTIYVAYIGSGEGIRYIDGGFWLGGKSWAPETTSLVFVVDDKEVIKTLLYANGRFYPTSGLAFEQAFDLPLYRFSRLSAELSLTSTVDYFSFPVVERKHGNILMWNSQRKWFRVVESGIYRIYVCWTHGFSFPSNTRISFATLMYELNGVGRILDTASLRIPIFVGDNFFFGSFTLQGYIVDRLKRNDKFSIRYELVQDAGGEPLTTANNDGTIYFIIEKIGGVYGIGSDNTVADFD